MVIGANLDVYIEVPRRPTSEPDLAVPGHLKTHAVFDTRWNVDLEVTAGTHTALASTVGARVRNGLTKPTTSSTGLRSYNVSKQATNLSLNGAGSATDVAGGWFGARLAARPRAGVAEDCRVNLESLWCAKNGFTQGQIDSDEGILPTFSARTRTAALSTSEEGVKNIAETEVAHSADWVLATHVIVATRFGIAEDLIRVGYELELLLGFRSWIYIRVQLASQLAVRLLDLVV
jgi:hypothetical protein